MLHQLPLEDFHLSFFFIEIHSMQDWTATTRHGVERKRKGKDDKYIGKLFRRETRCLLTLAI